MNSNGITRRRLLGNSAKLAAAAFASTLLPPNVRKALAAAPAKTPASLGEIKHVVLMMQENRSFDHYFGTMAGVRGLNDPAAIQLSTGKSVFHQPDAVSADGYLLPFHMDTSTSNAQKIPSTNHGWVTQHAAWNGGKMDNWLPAHRKIDGVKGPYCMGYFKRADIPFHFALAEAFTICDGYHCSVLGPTWPNRLYWMTGMIDPGGKHGGPVIKNKENHYSWTTYAERLESAGVSWKAYNFPTPATDLKKLKDTPEDYPFNMLAHFQQFKNAPADSPLRVKAMSRDSETRFAEDAANDRLPAVSWIMPPRHACEHPDWMPAAGAAFISRIIDAIAANPKVWAKTAFILNYDENDGIFDHVVPPTAPAGTPDEYVGDLPIGAGYRVPCIIVSPWTAGGWVCSETLDHTSILRFLEVFTGVREPNITDWRRQTFGDLTSAFRFDSPADRAPALPDAASALAAVEKTVDHLPPPPIPIAGQELPIQDKGPRKSTPGA